MSLSTNNDQLTTISPGYFVYIMSNEARDAFYISVTGYLSRKLRQHAVGEGYEYGNGSVSSCKDLIYMESHQEAAEALQRGEKIRIWNHSRITELITTTNPHFRSLNHDVTKETTSLL
jgi:putative endonuclease